MGKFHISKKEKRIFFIKVSVGHAENFSTAKLSLEGVLKSFSIVSLLLSSVINSVQKYKNNRTEKTAI
jgi:hypothetical protein